MEELVSQEKDTPATKKPPVTLHIAEPTAEGFAALYKRLTGKEMSAEGLAKLRRELAKP